MDIREFQINFSLDRYDSVGLGSFMQVGPDNEDEGIDSFNLVFITG